MSPEARQMAPEVAELLDLMGSYLHLDDTGHVLVALATAVSATSEGSDPLWTMLVGAPSGGKTEAIRTLDGRAEYVDELTAAALLSWFRGKPPRPTGILTRLPKDRPGFLTVGDFSTVLATSDRGGRDQLFADLRRVYDGRLTRDVGNAPGPLRWEGRLTLLAGVTPAIDNYSSHADQLGPRWLYYRLQRKETGTKRATGRKALAGAGTLAGYREKAQELAGTVVDQAARRVEAATRSRVFEDALLDVAIVTCYGRGAVPRNGYGRREIEGLAVIEEPPRLTGQLVQLAKGLLALGLDEPATLALCRRSALDSMPEVRRAALDALARAERLTVSEVARAAKCDRKVARMALEDLGAIGLTDSPSLDDEDEDPRSWRLPHPWWLAGPDAELVRQVMRAGRWDEKWGPPPTPPQDQGEHKGAPYVSSHLPVGEEQA